MSRRGGEKALDALVALRPGSDVFTLLHDAQSNAAPAHAGRVVASPLRLLPGARRFFRSLLPLFPWFYRRLDLSGAEVVISSDASLAKTVRVPDGATHLCYCYSPVRYAWDLRETYLQRGVPALLRPLARALLRRVARQDAAASAHVDRFVAISKTVAMRIESCYGRPADVVYPPVDTAFFTPGLDADAEDAAAADARPFPDAPLDATPDANPDDARPYLLLGAAVPYKRFDDAVEACARLDRPLIVAGDGPGWSALVRAAGPRTRFERAPDDARVRALFRACRALLYPGEEDFGLTAVEAMACGRPVIAWRRGGVAETVRHGETGWLYEVEGVDGLVEAIQAFERDGAALRPQACVRRAADFARPVFDRHMGAILDEFTAGTAPSRPA